METVDKAYLFCGLGMASGLNFPEKFSSKFSVFGHFLMQLLGGGGGGGGDKLKHSTTKNQTFEIDFQQYLRFYAIDCQITKHMLNATFSGTLSLLTLIYSYHVLIPSNLDSQFTSNH